MPRSLPQNPSLRFLREEAKDLVKAHKTGDVSCCPTLRYHFRFSRADDDEMLKADVTLQEVQHALALDYGFKSWKAMCDHVRSAPAPETTDAAHGLARATPDDTHKFFEQLAKGVAAGVPFLRILREYVDTLDEQPMAKIVAEVADMVERGHTLSEALSKHQEFDPVCVAHVRTGEAAGALEVGLDLIVNSRAAYGIQEEDSDAAAVIRYITMLLRQLSEAETPRMLLSGEATLPHFPSPDDSGSAPPDLQRVINRLKMMSGVTLANHKEPVCGRFELAIGGDSYEAVTTFADQDGQRSCEIVLTKRRDPAVGGQAQDLLSELIRTAVKDRASDLHIEPRSGDVKVRYRIDGALYEMKSLPHEAGRAVVDKIIELCKLDTERRHMPQDGRMMLKVEGRTIDIRINVSPVVHGSVVAMRLLDRTQVEFSLDRLGMEPDKLALYKKQIHASHGAIILTGPTGCGKTTTLYATLIALNDQSRKIMTVEDPVEFELEGIDQMPIRQDLGLGFEQALRSILRQAPNVIMAGEIRNLPVAQLIVQATLTGHLVFSTLHADDCPGALTRLINMGVAPYLVADAVRCVVTQRLVREICEHCKSEYKPEPGEFASLQLTDEDRERLIFHGTGCEHCRQTGYTGRGAIYSILPTTPAVARQIMNKDGEAIATAARADGWTTLREAAIRKMFRGETTPEEVIKFT